jgi:WD40 repeat protein
MALIPQLLLVLLSQTAPAAEAVEPVRVFGGLTADVYDVAFSADGRKVAASSFDRTIKVWDAASGAEIASLKGHEGKVLSIGFAADGRSLLSGSEDKTVKLWELPAAGAAAIAGHGAPVEALLLSADGRHLISSSSDQTVRVWERAAGKELLKLESKGPLHALALGPGGKLAAGGAARVVHVWSIAHITAPPPPAATAGSSPLVKQDSTWRYHKGRTAPPADWSKPGFDAGAWAQGPGGFGYSSDPAELATVRTKLDDMAGGGGYLSLFIRTSFQLDDPKRVERLSLDVLFDDAYVAYLNGEEVGRAKVQGSPPAFNAAADSSGEPVAVTLDLGPHLGKLRSGENVLALQGHNQALTSSDFVLTASLSAILKAAEPRADEAPQIEIAALEGSEGAIRAVAFSPGGDLVAAGGDDKAIRLWSLAEKGAGKKLDQGAVVAGLAFIDEGTLAAAGDDGAIKIWSLGEGKVLRSLAGHDKAVRALAIRADRGQLASAGEDGTVRLWDPAQEKELRSLSGHEGPVLCVAFAGDGKHVVTGGADRTLRAWRLEDGAEAAKIASEAAVRAIASSEEGRYYAAAEGNAILDWKAGAEAALTRSFTGHGGVVHAVVFAPDGATAASASSDKSVRFWSLADGKQIRSVEAHASSVYSLAYSPDGRLLASGGFDRLIKLWNTESGAEVKKLEGHGEGVFCLQFSADGQTLFSGSSDRTLRKWSVEEGKEIAVYEGHPGWVCGLALRPDGSELVSVDYGGNLITWSTAEAKPLTRRKLATVVYDLALSPDGQWLIAASRDGSAYLLKY